MNGNRRHGGRRDQTGPPWDWWCKHHWVGAVHVVDWKAKQESKGELLAVLNSGGGTTSSCAAVLSSSVVSCDSMYHLHHHPYSHHHLRPSKLGNRLTKYGIASDQEDQ